MKKRIDVLLTEKGLAKSREKAKTLVIAGDVYVNGAMVKSPSDLFDEEIEINVKKDDCPYVSRGGLKLKKAIDKFYLSLDGLVCMDIGASTGGFTDCMLKHGAKFVYAIDVGYGQFDWELRNCEQVELHERTNARYLEPFEKQIDFVSVDVSFISLALIFPAISRVCQGHHAQIVTLIKPQFEAGREHVGKKGVVRDEKVHEDVICKVIESAQKNELYLENLTYSPVKGPNGNIEYLAYFMNTQANSVSNDVKQVVQLAHENLD
ncbi:MAG: TlyA family RNA methyltransferase [Christensenellaceae bacterium]